MPIEAYSYHMNHVRMVKLRHDCCFHEKIMLGLNCGQFRKSLDSYRQIPRVTASMPVEALINLTKCALAQCSGNDIEGCSKRICQVKITLWK